MKPKYLVVAESEPSSFSPVWFEELDKARRFTEEMAEREGANFCLLQVIGRVSIRVKTEWDE